MTSLRSARQHRIVLLATLLWLVTMLTAHAQSSFDYSKVAPNGRVFFRTTKSDTFWLKVNGQYVTAEKAVSSKPFPFPLSVKIDISPTGGFFNAQGIPANPGITYRYWLDSKSIPGDAWQIPAAPGSHTVTVEFTQPGFITQKITQTFTMPGKPTGNVPPPVTPKPGGVPSKPDENRQETAQTDVATYPAQPGGLRYVPRLLVTNPTRTVDLSLEQIPPFVLADWFNTVYGDVGGFTQLHRERGWKMGHGPGIEGPRNVAVLYSNVWGGTKYEKGIADEAETPKLIEMAVRFVSGWRDSQGRAPRYIADDHERQNQDRNDLPRLEKIRGAIHRGLKAAFPDSFIGNYGIENIGHADPVEFEGGWYVVLNVWDGTRIIDACLNPTLWKTATAVYGEYAFEKVAEGRKAIEWRAGGKEFFTAFWNKWRDGCQVPGEMTARDDVAEGQVLLSLMSGSRGFWVWNAHGCQTPDCVQANCNLPDCDPLQQNLSATLHANAALWRMSSLNPLFDGKQEYFLPDVSIDGLNYTAQTGQYQGGARPAAYQKLYLLGGDIWAYQWPDNLPVVVGVRNRGKVAFAAVFPRELNPETTRRVWVKSGDFGDSFTVKGRYPALFTNL